MRAPLAWFFIFLLAAAALAAFAPLEKTLGANVRFVYFHGAWVWAGLLGFGAAALAGLAALLARRPAWHAWSSAFARAGLFFWVTFLPMSLVVMQANWNGLFLDEPRFRIPLNLAIVGLLLQAGLALFPQPALSSLANMFFGGVVFVAMRSADTILHPESPILTSGRWQIQLFFLGLVLLLLAAAWQMACLWRVWEAQRQNPFTPQAQAGEQR